MSIDINRKKKTNVVIENKFDQSKNSVSLFILHWWFSRQFQQEAWLTENAIPLREHFTVDEQITRTDLHGWYDDDRATPLLRAGIAGTTRAARATTRAPAAIAVILGATRLIDTDILFSKK